DRLGNAIWCLAYDERFPRHYKIGKLLVISHGEKFGNPTTQIILMVRDGLTDAEKLALETEIQLLIGGLVDCEGGISEHTQGWFATDTFYRLPDRPFKPASSP